MKKTIAAIALGCAAMFALTALTACGGGDDRESNSVEALVENYGYQWEDTSAPILNEKGAQEISFRIYSSKNASAKDYNDMDIMQTLYEDTNVFVEWENVSESIYAEQKNLIFSNTNNRPDAIYHAGMSASEIIRYASRKVLLPISDYLEYMPNFSRILEERPDIRKQITNVEDGKIYSLPRVEEMGLLQNPNLLFLNKNWTLEAIEAGAVTGLTAEDVKDGIRLTAAQMESLLTYFDNNDMNGNGQNDERPMTFVYNNWQGNQCDLYGMFGLNDNTDHRVIVDGKVTYTVLDDRFKEATQFINGWVEKGLIDEVSFEQTQDNFLANGKGTELYGAFYWWESETVVSDPENYVVCQPLVGPNGDQTICVSNNPEVGTGELVVFAGTPNVEVLLTYFDRYYDPMISAQINYGPIGIVYEEELDENGMLVQKELPEDKTADELRLENAPLGICYLSDYAWENVVHMEPRAQLRLERLEAYATPYVPAGVQPVPNLQFTQEELNTLTLYETNIVNYINQHLITWLRNGLTDADWEAFKNELVSPRVGLDEVRKVYQAAYDRYVAEN